MSTTLVGEVADAVETVIESPAVQSEITALITTGEGAIATGATFIVSNLKTKSPVLNELFALSKGSLETAITNEIAKLPPATVLAWINGIVAAEVKRLGG